MTSRKIKILIPLDNDGIFTYDIWEDCINNRIARAVGVKHYEISVMLAEGWTSIYDEAFKNIQKGVDVDEYGRVIGNDIIFYLDNILLPSSITDIHANAFTYATNLERLMFQRNNNITIHPNAFRGSGLQHVLMHSETLETLNRLDRLTLEFGKNNDFYGKDNVDINDISAYIRPNAGGARKSRRRMRSIRRKSRKASSARKTQTGGVEDRRYSSDWESRGPRQMNKTERQMTREVGLSGPGRPGNPSSLANPTTMLPRNVINNITGLITPQGRRYKGYGGKYKRKSKRRRTMKRK
jgi:hypothetical protein